MARRQNSPQRVADKYIAPDGGPPEPKRSDYGINEMAIAEFIISHDDGNPLGPAAAALASLCRLTGSNPARLRAVVQRHK